MTMEKRTVRDAPQEPKSESLIKCFVCNKNLQYPHGEAYALPIYEGKVDNNSDVSAPCCKECWGKHNSEIKSERTEDNRSRDCRFCTHDGEETGECDYCVTPEGSNFKREELDERVERNLKSRFISEFVRKLKGELYVYNNHMPEVIDEGKIDKVAKEFCGKEIRHG